MWVFSGSCQEPLIHWCSDGGTLSPSLVVRGEAPAQAGHRVRDSSFLHPIPPFCDAEKDENRAVFVQLDNSAQSNFPTVLSILLEKSTI